MSSSDLLNNFLLNVAGCFSQPDNMARQAKSYQMGDPRICYEHFSANCPVF